jgi:hypothetical protein
VRPQENHLCSAVEQVYGKPYPSIRTGQNLKLWQESLREGAVNYKSETPFDNIESALEYVHHLLGATNEAQAQIETEILRAASPELARRKQALQLVSYKLDKLSSHIAASRRILNDLRTLRRLLLEERKTTNPSPIT